MDIKTYFETRMKEITESQKTAPVPKGYFFLAYERNGRHAERTGPRKDEIIIDMKIDAENFLHEHETLHYMCRRIGNPDSRDSKEPER